VKVRRLSPQPTQSHARHADATGTPSWTASPRPLCTASLAAEHATRDSTGFLGRFIEVTFQHLQDDTLFCLWKLNESLCELLHSRRRSGFDLLWFELEKLIQGDIENFRNFKHEIRGRVRAVTLVVMHEASGNLQCVGEFLLSHAALFAKMREPLPEERSLLGCSSSACHAPIIRTIPKNGLFSRNRLHTYASVDYQKIMQVKSA
jgi:hypothetical protein